MCPAHAQYPVNVAIDSLAPFTRGGRGMVWTGKGQNSGRETLRSSHFPGVRTMPPGPLFPGCLSRSLSRTRWGSEKCPSGRLVSSASLLSRITPRALLSVLLLLGHPSEPRRWGHPHGTWDSVSPQPACAQAAPGVGKSAGTAWLSPAPQAPFGGPSAATGVSGGIGCELSASSRHPVWSEGAVGRPQASPGRCGVGRP